MNRCDYDHLIKGRERAVVTHGIIIFCVAVSYPVTETAECTFLNGFMVARFLNIIAMFAIDIIGIYNKMIPNASTARGAVTRGQ